MENIDLIEEQKLSMRLLKMVGITETCNGAP
ncbi:hypothetical protein CCACVL1_06744, partial [Corchorus capsularis]